MNALAVETAHTAATLAFADQDSPAQAEPHGQAPLSREERQGWTTFCPNCTVVWQDWP